MAVNIQIIFYSAYGHVYQMAEAEAEGARTVSETNVQIFQVAETLPAELLEKIGAAEPRKAFAHIPLADPQRLPEADAIILGSPTRYGSATSQMRAFLDATGGSWSGGKLIGKVGSAFTSTATQHGGQETTTVTLATFFYHQGMVIVGVPYSVKEMMTLEEITGGAPYGASTIAGSDGSRQPTENELAIARAQGRHVARVAKAMKAFAEIE